MTDQVVQRCGAEGEIIRAIAPPPQRKECSPGCFTWNISLIGLFVTAFRDTSTLVLDSHQPEYGQRCSPLVTDDVFAHHQGIDAVAPSRRCFT